MVRTSQPMARMESRAGEVKMDAKEIRKEVLNLINIKIENLTYLDKLRDLYLKIKNKLSHLLPPNEDYKIYNIFTNGHDTIFQFGYDRSYYKFLSDYNKGPDQYISHWTPEDKKIVKPAILEIFCYLKADEEVFRLYDKENHLKFDILGDLDLSFIIPEVYRTYTLSEFHTEEIERLKKEKKELSEISDKEFLKRINSRKTTDIRN